MSSLPYRLTTVFALALWAAAGFAPVAVALHVALHPDGHEEHLHTQHLRTRHVHGTHAHGEQGHRHLHAASLDHSRLLQVTRHEPRHEPRHDSEAAPSHDHEAVTRGNAPVPETSRTVAASVATSLAPRGSGAPSGEPSTLDRSLRRGPPTPLFTTHCALLL